MAFILKDRQTIIDFVTGLAFLGTGGGGGRLEDGIEMLLPLGVSGGGSDSNTFNEKGLRCVNLAIGMTDIHTVNESIAVDDLRRSAGLALSLMVGA